MRICPPLLFATLLPSSPGPGRRPFQPCGWYGVSDAFSSNESRSSTFCESWKGRTGGSGTGVLFATGVRSNVRRLSGTQSAGDGARRARLRERGRAAASVEVALGAPAEAESGEAVSSSVPFRLRAGRRWATLEDVPTSVGAGLPGVGSGEGVAAGLVPETGWEREGEAEPASRAGSAAAGVPGPVVVAAWATRHVFACRLRLEATPKRRPQLSHAKAGAEAP